MRTTSLRILIGLALIAALALGSGLLYIRSNLSVTSVLGQVIRQDEEQIKQLIIEYCTAVSSSDREGLKDLVAGTPRYYWNRQAEPTFRYSAEGGRRREMETGPAENEDFEHYNYQYLIDGKLLAWKSLRIPKAGSLEVRINGDHALVRTRLEFNGVFSSREDFFVVKTEGKWKLFNIAPYDEHQTFP